MWLPTSSLWLKAFQQQTNISINGISNASFLLMKTNYAVKKLNYQVMFETHYVYGILRIVIKTGQNNIKLSLILFTEKPR